MLITQIGLKQLLISVTIIILSSLCLQVQANDNPDIADYRLQKVVANPDKQAFPTQSQSIQQQSKVSAARIPEPVSTTKISGPDTNWPLVLLTPAIIGLVILLIPSWFSSNKTIPENQDRAADSIRAKNVADNEDDYLAMIEAEAELEDQLDAEEELDGFDGKTLGRIGARDRKHNSRVARKRKR